jgi:hypothetical protein
MADDFISGREFSSFRDDWKDRHDHISSQLGELLTLVRLQNGRIYKQEASIAVIEREISAIKAEDASIDAILADIQKNGCHQYKDHAQTLTVLEGAGVLMATDGHRSARAQAFTLPTLSTRQKAAAAAGMGALLIPAIGDLFQLGHAVFQWLAK